MALSPLAFRRLRLDWSRIYIAGVVNTTPDSFSDGGLYLEPARAIDHARALIRAGADIIDIGGESTRPGASPVSAADEIARVIPVIEGLADEPGAIAIAVDTSKAEVARAALAAGAEIVNDISGGLFDPPIIEVTAAAGAAYICGHVRGTSLAEIHAAHSAPVEDEPTGSAPTGPGEPDSWDEVAFELAERVARLPLDLRHRTIIDPGLGFGKRRALNAALVLNCGQMARSVGRPIMVGPSRKRFIRSVLDESGRAAAIDSGTVGACLAAAAAGANVVRVHNVELLKPALLVYEAIAGTST